MSPREVCTFCGEPARQVPRPGIAARLRAWFLHGDRNRGVSYECPNGHGWSSSQLQSYGRRRAPLAGVWRSVAFNRTVIPTPQSYTVMAAIGLAVGVVAQVVLGWPWWLGPIGFVVGSWAVALSTAFRGPQRRRTREQLRDQFDPDGALERHHERTRQAAASAMFAVVGLVEPPHPPRLGGFGGGVGEVDHVTVAYGDPRRPSEPLVEVETSVRDLPAELRKHMEEQRLRHHAAGMSPEGPTRPEMFSSPIEWSPAAAAIDGDRHAAETAAVGDAWSIVIDAVERTVVVTGARVGRPDLPELRSLEPAELAALSPEFG